VTSFGSSPPDNFALVQKYTVIETINWNTSSVQGDCLAYYDAPFSLVKSVQNRAFGLYNRWRGDVELKIELQSNAFQCGAIMVLWCPLMTSEQALSLNNGRPRAWSVLRNMILYAGNNNTVEFRVPYLHENTHLNLRTDDGENSLGSFLIYVLSPLRVGAASTATSCSLAIHARFPDSQFEDVNPTSVSIIPQGGVMAKGSITNNYNVTGSTIHSLDAHQSGDQFTGGGTDLKMNDYPNVNMNPILVTESPYPVISAVTGISGCKVLDAFSENRYLTPSTARTHDDEMDLSQLSKTLCYKENFVVSADNFYGQIVYKTDLAPASDLFTAPANSSLTPTLLGYVSAPFSYWRGGLRYKLVILASRQHSLRLQICSHYGFEATGLSVVQRQNQYSVDVEVAGVTEVELLSTGGPRLYIRKYPPEQLQTPMTTLLEPFQL